ncbi:hypothetical protein TruAng_001995 [Truncatella angustata]|nr:hypothetical protein TruAng_001995 [Truncatella angustata]
MASNIHSPGIWSKPDDQVTGNDCIVDATRHASLNTDLSTQARHYEFSTASQSHRETQSSMDQTAMVHMQCPDVIAADERPPGAFLELAHLQSHAGDISTCRPSHAGPVQEHGSPRLPRSQGLPPELPSLFAEIIFVLACTGGQVAVTQGVFGNALGIPPSQIPWLLGSSNLATGLSVIISGSLADLVPPKPLIPAAENPVFRRKSNAGIPKAEEKEHVH